MRRGGSRGNDPPRPVVPRLGREGVRPVKDRPNDQRNADVVRAANAAIRAAHAALRIATGGDGETVDDGRAADELEDVARAKGRADALATINMFDTGLARADAATRFLDRVRLIEGARARYITAYRDGAETLFDDLLGPGTAPDVEEQLERDEDG